MRDDFYADGFKQRNEQVNSIQSQITQLKGKTATIKMDVDEVSAELTEQLDDGVVGSYAYQTAQQIGAKVSKQDGNTSFGWTLESTGWSVQSNGSTVLAVNSSGLSVNGSGTFTGALSGSVVQGSEIKTTDSNGSISMGLGRITIKDTGGNEKARMSTTGQITSSQGVSVGNTYVEPNGVTVYASGGSPYATLSATGLSTSPISYTSAGMGNAGYYARVSANGNFIPASINMYCGTAGNPWQGVYGVNAYVETSDRNKKKNISEIPANYLDFVLRLAPKLYQFKDGSSGRFHVGFIAQDVEETMSECGISDIEFAGLVKDEGYYGLRYTEFIGLLTLAIQHQEQRLTSLEERLSRLEMKNNE